jgi:hypothetical protein
VPSGWLVHDQIDSNTISLGSWYSSKRILVKLPYDADTDSDGDGFSPRDGDCNDSDPDTFPGATETCGDGIDQDCDGTDLVCPLPTADQFALTSSTFSETDDLNAAVVVEYGPHAVIADFTEIKAAFTGEATTFCNTVGLLSYRAGAICLLDGEGFYLGYRHYFIERHDGVVPSGWYVHDQVDSNTISLGSWYNINKPILVRLPFGVDEDHDSDGYTIGQGDFDDDDPSINPGAVELCNDGIDQDCDGQDLQCILVPDDYTLIQDAIDVAATGSTIEVAAGTYSGNGNVNLDFAGKALTLRCEPGETCVIQCAVGQRGFSFTSGEGADSVVSGFTITGGQRAEGGGISCIGSSPTFVGCTITENRGVYYGGGVYLDDASPQLIDCIIEDNTSDYGGAVYATNGSQPTLTGCLIEGNWADYGGGLFLRAGCDATLTDCTVTGNAAYNGGGLYSSEADPVLVRCTITGNSGNSAGGLYLNSSDAQLSNCIVAGSHGSGIFCTLSSPHIINSTIAENNCFGCGGGIVCSHASSPEIINSIIWGNSDGIVVSSGTPSVEYSDIQNGIPGTGNLSVDPLFTDAGNDDFHLLAGSPCIDAGTSHQAPSDDIDGDARPQGAGIDIGADERW